MAFEFKTPRLRIRPWSPHDREALVQFTGDHEMMRYLSDGEAWPDERIDELTARITAHLEAHGVSFGAVELIDGGAPVGLVGLQQLDNGEFELGWWIWRSHWGQGLAVEAARPFIDHAGSVMGLKRLVAVIDPDNAASIRVAEKLGMRLESMKSARETMATRPDAPIAYYSMKLPTKTSGGA